jgi:hypothetical protein
MLQAVGGVDGVTMKLWNILLFAQLGQTGNQVSLLLNIKGFAVKNPR